MLLDPLEPTSVYILFDSLVLDLEELTSHQSVSSQVLDHGIVKAFIEPKQSYSCMTPCKYSSMVEL